MKPHPGFSDTEARRIIHRAAEIDSQQQPLDANALRAIAAEAGISRDAVERALEEHLQRRPSLAARVMRRPGLLLGIIVLALMMALRMFP